MFRAHTLPILLTSCFILAPSLGAALLSGCTAGPPEDVDESESEISSTGLADDADFGAVGAIEIWGKNDRARNDRYGCTGALVAPNLVLSTRRCGSDVDRAVTFRITKHVRSESGGTTTEERAYRIAGKLTTGREGATSLPVDFLVGGGGHDAALYILEESVVGVEPLKMRSKVLDASDEGRKLTMVGFGDGKERRKGPATLDAVTGQPYARAFATEQAFRTHATSLTDARFAERLDYHRLLDDDSNEAHAGLTRGATAAGDESTCNGARHVGAPLLERVGRHYEIVAIVNGGEPYMGAGKWFGGASEPSSHSCRLGTFLTKVSPQLQSVLAQASADPSNPTGWACKQDDLDRCSGNVRIDCSWDAKSAHVEDCEAHGAGFACVPSVHDSVRGLLRPSHCGRTTVPGAPPAFDDAPSIIKGVTTRFERASEYGTEHSSVPGIDFLRRNTAPATCALHGSGDIRCWGVPYDRNGVAGKLVLRDGVKLLQARGGNIALRATGNVVYWGQDEGGAALLGERLIDVGVSGGVDISEGCVVRANGTVACWNDDRSRRFDPADIAGVNDAVEVSGTKALGCARGAAGRVSCWKDGGAAVPTSITDAVSVQVNASVPSCAARKNGHVTCWRQGEAPSDLEGIDDAVKIVSSCALRSGGLVSCWKVAYGSLGGYPMPVAIQELHGVSGLSAAPYGGAICAHTKKGHAVSCWGQKDMPLFPYTPEKALAPQVVYDDTL